MRLVLLTSFVFWSGASLAQEQCVAIENDIERLACFDAAFSAGVPGALLDPQAEFDALNNVLASTYAPPGRQPVIVQAHFLEPECRMTLGRFAANSANLNLYLHSVLRLDVKNLESVAPGYGGLRFQMKRGHTLSRFEFWGGNDGNVYDAVQLRSVADGLLPALNNPDTSGGVMSVEPFFNFDATTPESEIDAQQIADGFMRLAGACNQAGG